MDAEAIVLWQRSDLVHLDGIVKRVGTGFLSITLPPPYAPTSTKWAGEPVTVGERVTVACQVPPRGVSGPPVKILVVELRRGATTRLVLTGRPEAPPPAPVRPPWIAALVRAGLLANESLVRAEHYGTRPVGVLLSVYRPTEARDRGFVHVDWKWRNDTDDIVAELAAIAGQPGAFALRTEKRGRIELDAVWPDGTRSPLVANVEPGDLDDLVRKMNRHLKKLGAERRIWTWDTGGDSLAFLGRAPWDVELMTRDGLPIDGLTMLDEDEPAAAEDWSDL